MCHIVSLCVVLFLLFYLLFFFFFFFFNDPATTEIYTLSLHDALPIYGPACVGFIGRSERVVVPTGFRLRTAPRSGDRKSTRLNSSHPSISYAVFCLKKKKKKNNTKKQTSQNVMHKSNTIPTDKQCTLN